MTYARRLRNRAGGVYSAGAGCPRPHAILYNPRMGGWTEFRGGEIDMSTTHPQHGSGGAIYTDALGTTHAWPSSRTCPICNHLAQVEWRVVLRIEHQDGVEWRIMTWEAIGQSILGFNAKTVLGHCFACNLQSLHEPDGALLWPKESSLPLANEDMPSDVKEFYDDARQTAVNSKRGALVLLRFCMEALLSLQGYSDGTLYNRIEQLYVSQRGGKRLRDALSAVRLVGNSAAHDNEIVWDREDLSPLFTLVNLIVDEFYTKDDSIADILSSVKQE